jgi:deoxyribose-phosphate aldolase
MKMLTVSEMVKYIDHTVLKPDADQTAFDKLCKEAGEYRFKAVCVNSNRVWYVASKLHGTGVEICSVVGFPLGAMDSRAKAFEAQVAVENGATELDMVMNIGALKSGDIKTVEKDIQAVRTAVPRPVILKVIIETCLLSDEEKILACSLAKNAGADFVKTSTGFSTGGAVVEDIALMRKTVWPNMGVKASGGIKNWNDAISMIEAGANRLGVSSGVAIIESAPK